MVLSCINCNWCCTTSDHFVRHALVVATVMRQGLKKAQTKHIDPILRGNTTLAIIQLLQCLQQVFLVDACCFWSAKKYGVLRKPNVQLPMHSSD